MFGLFKNLDLRFYRANYIPIIAVVVSLLWMYYCGIVEVLKNSLFDNIAVIPLTIALFLCYRAKKYKVLFRVLALFIILVIAREFNYGRCIFCQFPDDPHQFYTWSHYKYGWASNIVVGIYMFLSFLYAVINKVWIDIKNIIVELKIPICTAVLCIIALVAQIYFERVLDSSLFEELAEFFLYNLILVWIIIYRNKIRDLD